MPSVTSCFNRTLFRGALRRNWPLWCGYALLLILVIPCFIGNYLSVRTFSVLDLRETILNATRTSGITISAFGGIAFAMAMFHYLHFPRATGGMHTLPLRRDNLFLSHYLAGLFAQISTQAVVFIITLLICLPQFDFPTIATAFACYALPTVFFYSFGVLCMHCTGQILAAPVFYGIFNFLAVALEMSVKSVAELFLYGYSVSESELVLKNFSPAIALFQNTSVNCVYDDAGHLADVCFCGFSYYVIYAAVGVVLAALAFLLYRTRKSEYSGNTVTFSWMYPVFQYGVALCSAFSLGIAIYWIFAPNQISGHGNLIGVILSLSAGALIGFYAATMLLKKSFRVFRKSLWSALGIVAVLTCFCVCLDLDVTGYEKKIPDASEIDYVYGVNMWSSGDYFHGALYEEESINSLLDLHAAAVSSKGISANNAYYVFLKSDGYFDDSKVNYVELHFDYLLKDGSHFTRKYNFRLPDGKDAENDPLTESILAFLSQKETVRTYVFESNPNAFADGWKVSGGQCFVYANGSKNSRDFGLSAAEAQTVYEAALRDIEQGNYRQLTPLNYGDGALLDNYDRATCDINFTAPRENEMHNFASIKICNSMKETITALEEITGEKPF